MKPWQWLRRVCPYVCLLVPMSFIATRYICRVVVGLMLLLATAATCLPVSYDADDDDSTPPVTVDLGFICSGNKKPQSVKSQVRQATADFVKAQVSQPGPLLLSALETDAQPSLSSPQARVPLRR